MHCDLKALKAVKYSTLCTVVHIERHMQTQHTKISFSIDTNEIYPVNYTYTE